MKGIPIQKWATNQQSKPFNVKPLAIQTFTAIREAQKNHP